MTALFFQKKKNVTKIIAKKVKLADLAAILFLNMKKSCVVAHFAQPEIFEGHDFSGRNRRRRRKGVIRQRGERGGEKEKT